MIDEVIEVDVVYGTISLCCCHLYNFKLLRAKWGANVGKQTFVILHVFPRIAAHRRNIRSNDADSDLSRERSHGSVIISFMEIHANFPGWPVQTVLRSWDRSKGVISLWHVFG